MYNVKQYAEAFAEALNKFETEHGDSVSEAGDFSWEVAESAVIEQLDDQFSIAGEDIDYIITTDTEQVYVKYDQQQSQWGWPYQVMDPIALTAQKYAECFAETLNDLSDSSGYSKYTERLSGASRPGHPILNDNDLKDNDLKDKSRAWIAYQAVSELLNNRFGVWRVDDNSYYILKGSDSVLVKYDQDWAEWVIEL